MRNGRSQGEQERQGSSRLETHRRQSRDEQRKQHVLREPGTVVGLGSGCSKVHGSRGSEKAGWCSDARVLPCRSKMSSVRSHKRCLGKMVRLGRCGFGGKKMRNGSCGIKTEENRSSGQLDRRVCPIHLELSESN